MSKLGVPDPSRLSLCGSLASSERGKPRGMNPQGINLDLKNPRAQNDLEHMPPATLVEDILAKERKIIEIVGEIRAALNRGTGAGGRTDHD